jgi:hypothetical protein
LANCFAITAAALCGSSGRCWFWCSIGDIGAFTSGAVEAADAARRGAALAVYAFTGYVIAFASRVVAGVARDWFGDAGRSEGWSAAFAATALGSAVAACAMAAARPHTPSGLIC